VWDGRTWTQSPIGQCVRSPRRATRRRSRGDPDDTGAFVGRAMRQNVSRLESGLLENVVFLRPAPSPVTVETDKVV